MSDCSSDVCSSDRKAVVAGQNSHSLPVSDAADARLPQPETAPVTQPSAIVHARSTSMLKSALGPAIAAWLEDTGVAEVMLNADGRLWVDRLDSGMAVTEEWLSPAQAERRSEEHTSELQSLMRISYAVFCWKKKKTKKKKHKHT